ncbi:nuclear transport factor 2 family protein [Mycolicibacterium sp. XJ1819]
MALDTPAIVEELWAREQIRDCLYRYSRGIDRYDLDLVLSCYHPDAIDEHGIFNGNLEGFTELIHQFRGPQSEFGIMQHVMTNTLIEREGDVAHVESYLYNPMVRRHADPTQPDALVGGRFIDRFEKRNGRWAIAHRRVVFDYSRMSAPTAQMWDQWPADEIHFGTTDRNDPLYKALGE